MKIKTFSLLISIFLSAQAFAGVEARSTGVALKTMTPTSASAASNREEVLSFKDWKALKIQKSTDKWAQEAAQDLSVTDYLVLYVAKQGRLQRFDEIAAKLSPEEMGQIIEAFMALRASSATSLQAKKSGSGFGKEKTLPLSASLQK